MKTFPVNFSYSEDVNRRRSRVIRAEIKFSSEMSFDKELFECLEKSIKDNLIERIQRQIYGEINAAIATAERDIRALRENNPYQITSIISNLKRSIPIIMYD